MSDQTEGTWPEQNAVDAWVFKHGVSATHKELMELKEAVTEPRIAAQEQIRLLKVELKMVREERDAEAEMANKLQDIRLQLEAERDKAYEAGRSYGNEYGLEEE